MEKQETTKFKQLLEERKEKIEKELSSIATKDEKMKGDYDTRFPDFDTQSVDESALKLAAYESTLPIEYALELRLADINKALEKITKGAYGRCEKCNKEINSKRLEIMPEARFCLECQK
jgi:RNA polymerase-binding transcription factor DksA